MNTIQELIDQGLQDHQAMENPRPSAETAIYSVYCPARLVSAFKAVCAREGLPHSTISRYLMAEYIQSGTIFKFNDMIKRKTNNAE